MTHLLVVLAIVALNAAIFVALVWGVVWISRRRGRTVNTPDPFADTRVAHAKRDSG
jgi:hypothetical protein